MTSRIYLTVKHHFSAGHRIPGLAGAGAKCANLHGHTFGVEWTFRVGGLDAGDFEFAEAKKVLRGWVDEHLDHGYLVGPADTGLLEFLRHNGWKHYEVAPVPTTEAIAALLLDQAVQARGQLGADCTQVLVTEGPHNEARAVL